QCEAMQRHGDALSIADLAAQLQALALQAGGLLVVPLGLRKGARRGERERTRDVRVRGLRQSEQLPQPCATLREVAADRPESPQRRAESKSELDLAGIDRPAQGLAQVGVFALQLLERLQLAWSPQMRRGVFGRGQVVLRVPAADLVGSAALREMLQCVIADGGQHGVAWKPAGGLMQAQQAMAHQAREPLEHVYIGLAVCAHRFACLRAAATVEDAEPCEERLLLLLQQVVAPHERA